MIRNDTNFIKIPTTGSETILKGVELSQQQLLGVKIAIRYGIHLKLIQSNVENSYNLILLLKKAKCFLQGQQHKGSESNLSILLLQLNSYCHPKTPSFIILSEFYVFLLAVQFANSRRGNLTGHLLIH